MWKINLDIIEKSDKIDAICKDLLEKLDNITDWLREGQSGVRHKTYNLEVYSHVIHTPYDVTIPIKWRRRIRKKIKKIHHAYKMESLNILHNIILDKYPLQVRIGNNEQKQWLKENADEQDYINIDYWYYFKNESVSVAFKLRWL